MPDPAPITEPTQAQRDGTSQAARPLAALDPGSIAIDDRSVSDLLAVSRDFARRLVYHPADGSETLDWSGFIPADLDLDAAVAFLEGPATTDDGLAARLTRPHFVLLLTFLRLRRQIQQQLNGLTGRHLDFYYRRVLQLTRKAAVPERVNVLVDLASGVERALLPAGTLLAAGEGGSGNPRLYRTDTPLVVSRARVARVSSVHVAKRSTGIREARERNVGTQEDRTMLMLRIALGRVSAEGPLLPGGSLPPFPWKGQLVPLDFPFLIGTLKPFVDFAWARLSLTFFELRRLVELKTLRDRSDVADWAFINETLARAYAARTKAPASSFQPKVPSDFAANLEQAVGRVSYDGLPEVDNVEELYEQAKRDDGTRADVAAFIPSTLFMSVADFRAMMDRKLSIEGDWDAINALLETAGRRRWGMPDFRLDVENRYDFAANFRSALEGKPDGSPPEPVDFKEFGGSLEAYAVLIGTAEDFFSMRAEQLRETLDLIARTNWTTDTTPGQWDRVYGYLAEAHRQQAYGDRRRRLQSVREEKDRKDGQGGFDAMVREALGEAPANDSPSPLDRLKNVLDEADWKFLQGLASLKPEGVPADDWDRAYRLVEAAGRLASGMSEPVALKEEWLNLYPAADATEARVVSDAEAGSVARWRTFGQAAGEGTTPSTPVIGWAIRSPMLELGQGKRSITLTLGFAPESMNVKEVTATLASSPAPFVFQVSTAKGWREPSSATAGALGDYAAFTGSSESLGAIRFNLALPAEADPVAPIEPVGDEPASPWPSLRLMLRPAWNEELRQFVAPYAAFRSLVLKRVHLRVEVGGNAPADGLTDFLVQNDETGLDPKKPFEPFGSSPAAGSRFFLGHPELVRKRLDTLTFYHEWMGVPDDLKSRYRNYGDGGSSPALDNGAFTARISLVDRNVQRDLLDRAPLFDATKASTPRTITAGNIPQIVQKDSTSYRYGRILDDDLGNDLLRWDRRIQWQLNSPDFQHQTYPISALRQSTRLAADISNKKENLKAEDYQVNPPYTPRMKSLSLGYSASLEIILGGYRRGAEEDRIEHVHPFGIAEIMPDPGLSGDTLLPRYDDEGQLYIGISDLRAPQTLTLLFQMAEGSADPDLEPAQVRWSYLGGDGWIGLDGRHVLSDTTRGLINSGIMTFDLGAASPSTLMPADLAWIRAAVARNSAAVCDTVGIDAQGVSATSVERWDGRRLPPGTISGLAEPAAEIAGLRQPYASFGGTPDEEDAAFYNRVSERLRHKRRALAAWDYERLILDQFPQIYKVKCLPADPADEAGGAGQVLVVVIPDVRDRLPFNPFEPKAPADLIADISAFLADKVPSTARVRVQNARFVQVQVRVGVRFSAEGDVAFYRARLVDELNRFLSPWAYQEGADLVIGGRIYANSIVSFIDGRPYIDYVAHIALFTSEDGETFLPAPDGQGPGGYYVTTSRPDEVLVAARDHVVDLIGDVSVDEDTFKGINYMRIGLDFRIAPS